MNSTTLHNRLNKAGLLKKDGTLISKYITLFDALKLKFTTGNSSPRGGVEGDYIKITKSEINKLTNQLKI